MFQMGSWHCLNKACNWILWVLILKYQEGRNKYYLSCILLFHYVNQDALLSCVVLSQGQSVHFKSVCSVHSFFSNFWFSDMKDTLQWPVLQNMAKTDFIKVLFKIISLRIEVFFTLILSGHQFLSSHMHIFNIIAPNVNFKQFEEACRSELFYLHAHGKQLSLAILKQLNIINGSAALWIPKGEVPNHWLEQSCEDLLVL